jgi:hypothetical protein
MGDDVVSVNVTERGFTGITNRWPSPETSYLIHPTGPGC